MPLDPNWFYSSLAQAAAAIVGIVGGFLLTAILRQRDHVLGRRRELIRMARNVRDARTPLMDGRSKFAAWAELYLKPENALPTSQPVPLVKLTGAESKEGLVLRRADYEELARLKSDTDMLLGHFRELGPLLARDSRGRMRDRGTLRLVNDSHSRAEHHSKAEHTMRFARGGEQLLHEFTARLEDYYRLRAVAEGERIPFSFWLFTALLAFIAVTGVLMPLQELSAKSEGSRNTYVLLASVGLLGLLVLVLVQLWQLRQLIDITPHDLNRPD